MHQIASRSLALLGVVILISFLAYGPQILFQHIEPHPLERKQAIIFNALICCICISYAQTCLTNPGWVPQAWSPPHSASGNSLPPMRTPRWCRKCEAFKPPRAHHCKICRRCIPKMDHHCPWTINCVSHRTFPHFFRFLFYATASMIYLEYFLYLRIAVVWAGRNLPSYLGPTPTQLVFLFIFLLVNSITLFALAILLLRNIWCLGGNVTTIEGWEIERHETLVRRARVRGGYLEGPDGARVRFRKQEFPYDIGILPNIRQGMGGPVVSWLWPFTATPSNESGLNFETNGFEDPSSLWPPPDPDRMHRPSSRIPSEQPFVYREGFSTNESNVNAFRRRQQEDQKRHHQGVTSSNQPKFLHGKYRREGGVWRDSQGDRLEDFGVDEDAEHYDEDEIPLTELLRRRHVRENYNDNSQVLESSVTHE